MKSPYDVMEENEEEAEKNISEKLQQSLEISMDLLNFLPSITHITKMKNVDDPNFYVLLIQHSFLKLAMTSLRSICILLTRGYTAQAATIASSLFETYLYSSYIGNEIDKANKYKSHRNSRDFVWRLEKMENFIAERDLKKKGKVCSVENIENEKLLINAYYIFLCSIKHVNPIPLWHTVSTKIEDSGLNNRSARFTVIPDIRPEDIIVKEMILAESNFKTTEIVKNILQIVEKKDEYFEKWQITLLLIQQRQVSIYQQMCKKYGPMPYPTIIERK